MPEVIYSEAEPAQALRAIIAYLAAAAAGALMFSMIGLRSVSIGAVAVGTMMMFVAIVIVLAPFWLATTFIARRLSIERLPVYCLAAVLLGDSVGPTVAALLPDMVWEGNLEPLSYSGRWIRSLRTVGPLYAAMGGSGGAVYWLIAVGLPHWMAKASPKL